ncbi:fumarylacetoacetate hydrolase family protein [Streptomyces sp. NPDC050560]|uniref:fumarylacetoacetate hydrolase family protein n=1 Tax=Streptomyces sp. NPDC050560 TaxID=3365630 RepID=UPI00378C442A
MRLALFDDNRLGVVTGPAARTGTDAATEPGDPSALTLVDVTDVLPWPHESDPLVGGWWRALCRDFAGVAPELAKAAREGTGVPLGSVRLGAPVLGPSKIIASASNYRAHVDEMHEVQRRTLGRVEAWMMDFDVFLKAPSAVSGPADPIVLPRAVLDAGEEVHHESELVVVVGTGGKDIPVEAAPDHILGYTIGLDITVRSAADRSRRKSYDTFSPLGPWLTTADEVGDPGALDILLTCNGEVRQHVSTATLITSVPEIVSYASRMMTLNPGDVIFTGAPPGVGPIRPGDELVTSIGGLGSMTVQVVAENR